MRSEEIKCPKCGSEKGQHKKGFTVSGNQRMYCNACKYKYTPNPKSRAYSDAVRKQPMKAYTPEEITALLAALEDAPLQYRIGIVLGGGYVKCVKVKSVVWNGAM